MSMISCNYTITYYSLAMSYVCELPQLLQVLVPEGYMATYVFKLLHTYIAGLVDYSLTTI